ncbi:MAG: hypothetical protein PVJ76_16765 [Gemmatimonadota bacterium]
MRASRHFKPMRAKRAKASGVVAEILVRSGGGRDATHPGGEEG